MPDILNNDYGQRPQHMAEFGNAFNEDFPWNKAATAGDKLYFGILPAGVRVTEVDLYLDDNIASGTLSLGFEPVDTLPSPNLTYWLTTQTLGTAGRFESLAAPITFDYPVKVVGSLAGANLTTANNLSVIVEGRCLGVR